jgi:hypothetical protein
LEHEKPKSEKSHTHKCLPDANDNLTRGPNLEKFLVEKKTTNFENKVKKKTENERLQIKYDIHYFKEGSPNSNVSRNDLIKETQQLI